MGCTDSKPKPAAGKSASPPKPPRASAAASRPAAQAAAAPAAAAPSSTKPPAAAAAATAAAASQQLNVATGSTEDGRGSPAATTSRAGSPYSTTRDQKATMSHSDLVQWRPKALPLGEEDVVTEVVETGVRPTLKGDGVSKQQPACPSPGLPLPEEAWAAYLGPLGTEMLLAPCVGACAAELAVLPTPFGYEKVRTRSDKVVFRKSGVEEGTLEHPFVMHYRRRVFEALAAADKDDATMDATVTPQGAETTLKIQPRTFASPAKLFVSDGQEPDAGADDYNKTFQELWESQPLMPEEVKQREVALLVLLRKFEGEAVAAATEFVHLAATTNRNQRVRRGNLLLSFQNSRKAAKVYGSRAVSVKMHQHEATGLRCALSSDVRELHVPLHCTVSYLGCRVNVVAALPPLTKVLGAHDSTLASLPKHRTYINEGCAEELVSCVAADYRLAPHNAASEEYREVRCGAAATEVARGTDGRLYLTQGSRLMPAMPLWQVDSRAYRPEFVKAYRQGDGLSCFMLPQEQMAAHMERYAANESVAFFAEWLVSDQASEAVEATADYADVFHHFGVRMKQIKLVHDAVLAHSGDGEATEARKESRVAALRTEAQARALKRLLRDSSDAEATLAGFLAAPQATLSPVTEKKYNWNLTDPEVAVKREAVLLRVSALLMSTVSFDNNGPGGALQVTGVALNRDAMKETTPMRPAQFVYSFARGYMRLRPELMRALDKRQQQTHISSDAMSVEAQDADLGRDVGNVEALISSVLLKEEIPQFASDILRRPPESQEMLCNLSHEAGINLHFLGAVVYHLLEWGDDGDWRTVRDTVTGTPVALHMALIEILARSFVGLLEDEMEGKTPDEAHDAAKAAFQRLLNDQEYLWDEACRKFYLTPEAAALAGLPPLVNLVTRCCELSGALLVMKDGRTVAHVALTPRPRCLGIPPHLKAVWLVDDTNHKMHSTLLPAVEHQITDRLSSRPPTPEGRLSLLSILSLVYQRWNQEEPGAKAEQLLAVRKKIVALTGEHVESLEHGDANMLVGDCLKATDDAKQAAHYYNMAYDVYKKVLQSHKKTLGAALGVAHCQATCGDANEDAIVWFERARVLAKELKASDEKILEIEVRSGECCAVQGKHEEAVKYFTEAIMICSEIPNTDQADIAKLLESVAREKYSLGQLDEATQDFQKAMAVFYKVYGMDCTEIADISVCLGQLACLRESYCEARDSYEVALQTYTAVHGEKSEEARSLLTDHLAPCYDKMSLNSQRQKCLLQIAVCYEQERQIERATKYFHLAMDMHSRVNGDSHKFTLKSKEWLEHLGGAELVKHPPIKATISPRYGPASEHASASDTAKRQQPPARRSDSVSRAAVEKLAAATAAQMGLSPATGTIQPTSPPKSALPSGVGSIRPPVKAGSPSSGPVSPRIEVSRPNSSYRPLPTPASPLPVGVPTITLPTGAPAGGAGTAAGKASPRLMLPDASTEVSPAGSTGGGLQPPGAEGGAELYDQQPRTIRSMLCKTGFGTFRNIEYADVGGSDGDGTDFAFESSAGDGAHE